MNPRLDVRHLQMMIALGETGSVAEAAHVLSVTPSALSHRIREAERRLDMLLVERAGRGVRLTPGAEHLAEGALRVLDELERLETDVASLGKGVEHVVRLAVGTYNSYHWLPAFLTAFHPANPATDVDVVANAGLRPLASLQAGEIDVAIVSDMPIPPGLRRMALFTDELIAVMPPDHRLADREYIDAEDLAEETVLTYSLTPSPGYEGERFWQPARVTPQRVKRVELVEAIVELVKAGFGISILTRWAMEPHLRAGTLAGARVTEKGLKIGWSAVTRNAERPGSPAHDLAARLSDWCAGQDLGFPAGPA